MLERRHGTQPSIKDLARTENIINVLPDGDILYASGERNLLISPLGASYMRQGIAVTDYFDKKKTIFSRQKETLSGMRCVVTKEYAGKGQAKEAIAVKSIIETHSNPEYWDLHGIEQFTALRALQEEGIPCAVPLAATEKQLITKWVDEPLATTSHEAMNSLPDYLVALDHVVFDLKQKGKWKDIWKVEWQPTNYAIADLANPDIIKRFIAIDPAYIYSLFEF